MTKQHIEQIFKDSLGYVPVDIKFTDNSREVALGMIHGKARRRGNSFMVQSAQQAVDCLHTTAEEMEAVLADRRFAA